MAPAPRVTVAAEFTGRHLSDIGRISEVAAPAPDHLGIETVRSARAIFGMDVVDAGGSSSGTLAAWLVRASVLMPGTSAGLTSGGCGRRWGSTTRSDSEKHQPRPGGMLEPRRWGQRLHLDAIDHPLVTVTAQGKARGCAAPTSASGRPPWHPRGAPDATASADSPEASTSHRFERNRLRGRLESNARVRPLTSAPGHTRCVAFAFEV